MRETAYYECIECKHRIGNEDKPEMLRAGTWAREGERVEKDGTTTGTPTNPGRHAGFHLPSWYAAPIKWGDALVRYLKAIGHPRKMQNFMNSWAARPFVLSDKQAKWEDVKANLTVPGLQITFVPKGARFLTAGVDVQQDSFYVSIWAWQNDSPDAGRPNVIPTLADYAELVHEDDVCEFIFGTVGAPRQFDEVGGGRTYQVKAAGVDSGFKAKEVYDFCKRVGLLRCVPTKGEHGSKSESPWWTGNVFKTGKKQTRIAGGIKVYHINTNIYKQEIYTRMEKSLSDAGRVQFPQGVHSRFFQQLCAEALVEEEDKRGRQRRNWVVIDRKGNHYLDTFGIASAIADVCGIQKPPPRQQQDPPASPRQPIPGRRSRW
jgi:phage terminase large subunit GpA-like protein